MNKIKYFEKEISYIKNKDYQEDIKYLINLLPEYFFVIGDCKEDNPKYLIKKNGLLKQTKVAIRIAYDMFDTVNNFTDNDKDLIIMALIMHDGLLMGEVLEDNIRCDHPLLVSSLIIKNINKLKMSVDDVRMMCTLIESHMGNDYDKELPIPKNEISRYVYRCCFLASRSYMNISFDKLEIK